jgi:HEPN domain-containing protein
MLHGLFFCHLVIEKILKAHVVKDSQKIAPRTHNLIHLLEKTHLELSESEEIFLGILMKYQLQGRYPDYNPIIPNKLIVQNYLKQTENLLQWLKKKL